MLNLPRKISFLIWLLSTVYMVSSWQWHQFYCNNFNACSSKSCRRYTHTPPHTGKRNIPTHMHNNPAGHSNTSFVQIRDQRFSKHTLIKICPVQKKTPKQDFHMIFGTWFYLLDKILFLFLEHLKNDPLTPLIVFKQDPFSWKQAHFEP